MLDVFLTAPHDFHRPVHLLRDLDGEDATVDVQPPAEAAAEQMVVNLDRILRQAGDLGDRALGKGGRLGADPKVTAILADVNGAVHRLHRGMREERHLIDGVNPLDSPGKRLFSVAVVPRHRAGSLRRLLELADDIGAAECRIRTVIPSDGGRLEPFLGRGHMVGDHGNGIVDPDHLTHTSDAARRRLVQ